MCKFVEEEDEGGRGRRRRVVMPGIYLEALSRLASSLAALVLAVTTNGCLGP